MVEVERTVGVHELFFSTTDRRGVIKAGNSVFVRISQYDITQLLGAPHNVIRHPEMPSGAFRLMWDRLLSGRPMAAYVKNRTRDGADYSVFATVTPLGDDFLSVRMAPMTALRDAAFSLYREVTAYERDLALRDGLSRPQVALAGAAEIERRLAALGFAGYDDFMLAALPAEVSTRAAELNAAFARPGAAGPLGHILAAAHQLDRRLAGMVARLGVYADLSTTLTQAAAEMLDTTHRLQASVDAARAASETVAEQTPVLRNVAQVMGQPMGEAVAALRELAARLIELRREVSELGFRIALARLHTEMVCAFTAEVIDGLAPAASLVEVPRLCDAVQEGVSVMAQEIGNANDALGEAADQVRRAGDLLDAFRTFLGQWRLLVLRHRHGSQLAAELGPIDAQLDSAYDQMQTLRGLAQQCRAAVTPFDRAALQPPLERIRVATDAAHGGRRDPVTVT